MQDWYKNSQTRLSVRDVVGEVLDEYLPKDSYGKKLYTERRDSVFEMALDLAINNRMWAAQSISSQATH